MSEEEEERNGNSADRVSGLTKGQNSKLWVCVLVWITKRNDSILMGRRCKLGELCSLGMRGFFFLSKAYKGVPSGAILVDLLQGTRRLAV